MGRPTLLRHLRAVIALFGLLALAACAQYPEGPPPADDRDVVELTRSIRALGPEVDPDEAARAARIALDYTHQLSRQYEITDPPLVHNMKVNAGLRPRGLCWHWAEDMENRLKAEGFETLQMHRAIANADHPIFIDHSTAIISARGENLFEGLVLDPWRFGGVLHWSPTLEDPKYTWVPREIVLAKRRDELARERTAVARLAAER